MEFYLVDDLECDLVVYHPYRTLLSLVRDMNQKVPADSMVEKEAGEVGRGVEVDRKFWGSGEGRLVMHTGGIQFVW